MELTAHLSFGTVVLMTRQLKKKQSVWSIFTAAVKLKHMALIGWRHINWISTSLRGREEKEQWFGHDTGNAGHTVSLCFWKQTETSCSSSSRPLQLVLRHLKLIYLQVGQQGCQQWCHKLPVGQSKASWSSRTRSSSLCVYISSSDDLESLSSSFALYIYPTDREPRRTDTHSGGPAYR